MRRRGFTVLETMVAAAMLAVAATISIEILLFDSAARRDAERQCLAAREAANVMERLMAASYDELTPEMAQGIRLTSEAAGSLPQAKLESRVDENNDDGLRSKRVAVSLNWEGGGGGPSRAVRLFAWRFDQKEPTP